MESLRDDSLACEFISESKARAAGQSNCGKLVAMLLTDKSLRQHWKKTYGDELIGLTTTSLYGIHSMYNGIPLWKTLGESAGKISLKPDDSVYKPWHKWMKDEREDEREKEKVRGRGKRGTSGGKKGRERAGVEGKWEKKRE